MRRRVTTIAKVLITGLVTIFIFGNLLWDHLHGGVPSHHLLHQKELPSISNWWSGLMLPLLAWFLLHRIDKRISQEPTSLERARNPYHRSWILFSFGLAFGILISVSFENEYTWILDHVLYGFILASFFIPIFYSEFILAFILGMTLTFGAILPSLFIMVMAAIGFISFKFIRPLTLKALGYIINYSFKGSKG